jgi:hypothetical protein
MLVEEEPQTPQPLVPTPSMPDPLPVLVPSMHAVLLLHETLFLSGLACSARTTAKLEKAMASPSAIMLSAPTREVFFPN